MTIDRAGHILKSRISETVIKTAIRFSYAQVQNVLDKRAPASPDKALNKRVTEMLFDMAELTKTLEKIRRKRGEVILNIPEPKIILDPETRKIVDVVAYPHWLAHRIVETFMILCNETIAQYAIEHGLPFVYRIHEKPDAMKVNRLIDMLKPFGVQHNIRPDHPNGLDYQKMLERANPDILPVVSQLALRSMQKAKYDTNCVGHFGLGSKFYCHFTSPIRRLPDLIIHRILKMVINKQTNTHKLMELADYCTRAADQSSKTELTATEVEREVDNLKRAEYMNEHIGEKFSGVVSGVTDFGVFVYLPNTVEGLIKMDNLPRDHEKEFYTYNERTATLQSKKRTIKMGDKIDVVCIGVNMARRQVEFAAAPQH
jgi:ribonuclease R